MDFNKLEQEPLDDSFETNKEILRKAEQSQKYFI
jgi:hypothetical protein